MTDQRYRIINADCIEAMREMPDNSVDSIVTDPPYGISFMGKRWDYDVPSIDTWRECLRVLKPGGHLLAFAGTRTQHRMAVRIEDAGFEIRDMIAWVYGSGFPKSLNVSKAIDKQGAVSDRDERAIRCTTWLRETGITAAQVNEITGTVGMASHYLSRGSQPAVPTREHLELLRPHLPPIPQWVEDMVDQRIVASENFAARPVVGTKIGVDMGKATIAAPLAAQGVMGTISSREYNITTANTPEAAKWEGWGTALKPALEPITVARKPLFGTVADNVLRHGTGAMNIDGCRVGDEPSGRFPANLIHDGSEEVLGIFPVTKVGGGVRRPKDWATDVYAMCGKADPDSSFEASEGSAARYFYCAKASKRDRDEGLDAFREAAGHERAEREEGSAGMNAYAGTRSPARNTHPTVKPTQLMRYLCRLVTPPDGIVLDPFCGSGSTGKAAILENFRFVGLELDPDYVDIAEARCEWAERQVGLMAEGIRDLEAQSEPAELDRNQRNLFDESS